MNELKYLILDNRQCPIAQAVLESAGEGSQMQIRIIGGSVDSVISQESVQLVGMSEGTNNLFVRVIRARGERVLLENNGIISADVRENLRIPVRVKSYLYPISGAWKGRRDIVFRDLSCGGIAFFCARPLDIGEQIEIVVPVTTWPLLLKAQIIRTIVTGSGETLYSAKFIDMIHDEETFVREAVFGIQLQNLSSISKQNRSEKERGFS